MARSVLITTLPVMLSLVLAILSAVALPGKNVHMHTYNVRSSSVRLVSLGTYVRPVIGLVECQRTRVVDTDCGQIAH